jgi:hypothetical protein
VEKNLLQTDPKAKSSITCGPLSNFLMVNYSMNNGHRAGGLAIIWNCNIHVDILQFNKMFIDTYITSCNSNFSWYSTGFCGSPYSNKKHLTCNAIKDLHNNRINENWLIFGDFNLIRNSSEKLGGNGLDINLSDMFHDTLNQCDLIDLGYQGNTYTWANNQAGSHHIKERLDRYCANSN